MCVWVCEWVCKCLYGCVWLCGSVCGCESLSGCANCVMEIGGACAVCEGVASVVDVEGRGATVFCRRAYAAGVDGARPREVVESVCWGGRVSVERV